MTKYGVQGSVMGWDDPWHPSNKIYLRTGEGQHFPSQDVRPDADGFVDLVSETFGCDFLVYHPNPELREMLAFVDDMDRRQLHFLWGNEVGCINRVHSNRYNRYDIPIEAVEYAQKSRYFCGLLYDETEHNQIHSRQYDRELTGLYQWGDPNRQTLDEAEASIEENVRLFLNSRKGISVYNEHVFPLMYHIFARAGMNPCPKALKEEYQCVQFATAMGAAKQYGRKLGVCVDLWGPDVGAYFTRLWGFPGHSPEEFRSALLFSHFLSPDFVFVENVDVLARNTENGFVLTEYGEIYREHLKARKAMTLPYRHSDVTCDTAVIRSDDCLLSDAGNFYGDGPFGSQTIPIDKKQTSYFRVLYALTHQTISKTAPSLWNSGMTDWPTGDYKRTEENMALLPMENGVGRERQTNVHPVFYPMNNVLIFDEKVSADVIGDAKLIILCGSRASRSTVETVLNKVKNGASAVVAGWFTELDSGRYEGGRLLITEDFESGEFRSFIRPFIGSDQEWNIRFGRHVLQLTSANAEKTVLQAKVVRA